MDQNISILLDEISESVVFAEVDDKGSLGNLHNKIEQLGNLYKEMGDENCLSFCSSSLESLESIILDEHETPGEALEEINRAVMKLQQADNAGISADKFPKNTRQDNALNPSESYKLPSHIDQELFTEFMSARESVLQDLEDGLVEYENSGKEPLLSDIKRIIHTQKGEAGLMGMHDIESVCHVMEDLIVEGNGTGFTDPLIMATDWMKKYFSSFSDQSEIEMPVDELLEKMKAFDNSTVNQNKSEAKTADKPQTYENSVNLPGNVDEKLFGEFIDKQLSLLQDLEVMILELERKLTSDNILSLKGIFHNQKGEAALMGLSEAENVCHKTEDILEAIPDDCSDLLLEIIDWLRSYYQEYAGDISERYSYDEILNKIDDKLEQSQPTVQSGQSNVFTGDLELAVDFINEANEHLENCDGELIVLEQNPTDDNSLNSVFRAFHTIKGVAGFIGLEEIQNLAHATENMLDLARQKKLMLQGETMDVVFRAVDKMKSLITGVAQYVPNGQLPPADKQLPVLLTTIGQIADSAKDASVSPIIVLPSEQEEPKEEAGPTSKLKLKESLKVDAEKLNLLVDTIGELVISETMITQSDELRDMASLDLQKKLNRLDKITRELQELGTSLRMVPVSSTFRKMARLARDLSKKFNKPIDFIMTGEETELDKSLVDKISDPLVHMIRNSLDHGIENSADIREENGKSRKGRVELRAFHAGGSIFIEVEDDGRGLKKEALINKAIEKGVIQSADGMTENEIFNLIFAPGFSTTKKVTDVSGRGVGMDVVRKNIESLRGKVIIKSEEGRGSVFSIKLPLTLAIIDGMIIRIGDERYIVPTLSVINSMTIDSGDLTNVAGKGVVFNFHGRQLSLLKLYDVFSVNNAVEKTKEGVVVVVESDDRRIGIMADELLGQQQIVIKPLSEMVKKAKGIAGGAIMPDGKIALILDVSTLVKSFVSKN